MNITIRKTLFLLVSLIFSETINAQGIQMGEVVIISASSLKKNVKPEAFNVFINEAFAAKKQSLE